MDKHPENARDLLSPEEIEALLSTKDEPEDDVETAEPQGLGGTTHKHAVLYDFRHPRCLTSPEEEELVRRHRKMAHVIEENYARLISARVDCVFKNLAYMSSQDYRSMLRGHEVFGHIVFKNGKGRVLIEFEASLVFSLLDHMLGGPGEVKQERRTLTDVESALFCQVLRSIKDTFNELCSHHETLYAKEVIPIAQRDIEREPSQAYDKLVAASFSLHLPKIDEGTVKFIYSPSWLRAMIKSRNVNMDELKTHPVHQGLLGMNLGRAHHTVSVELGHVEMGIRQLMALKITDIIKLNLGTEEACVLKIGGLPKFTVKLLDEKQRRYVKILKRI
ncbi:FliM/FliN family flagellar motor switch protein [PVC group bacterium]|nr:FliM/FliN family flagellar motor switch protein [PVC group bacterium]